MTASLGIYAPGQRRPPWPGEFPYGFRSPRHRHQQCFSGAAHFRTVPVLPRDVRRRKSQPFDSSTCAKSWVSGHQRQYPLKAINGDCARTTECSADVLVVDSSIYEGDHSAKTRCEPLRTQMSSEEVHEFLRRQRRELFDTNLVCVNDTPLGESLDQT